MPALFVFLVKVNIALLLFCAGYYLVLRHLTFYTLNRIYLVTAILFASVYPQINLSGFAQRHRQITNPVQAVVFNLQAPAQTFIKPITQTNYWYWAEVVFWLGVVLLAIRLLVQLYSLYRLYRNSTAAQIYGHKVRVINADTGPFSFGKSIYVNPAKHAQTDLKAILLHEQVHVNEGHTGDIMLAELSTIFYWFNPGVWLMKKAIRENIEFITDRKILNYGVNSKQYQYSLVSVSFGTTSPTIVNHFNISTIKKRIIMMNAKKSSRLNLTRYAFLVPAVVVLLLVFSISKAAFVKKSTKALHQLTAEIKAISTVKPAKTMSLNGIISSKIIKDNIQLADTNYLTPDKTSAATVSNLPDTTKANRSGSSNIRATMYIVDEMIVKSYDINNINTDNIKSIDVGKSVNGSAVVYINTKNGTNAMPHTKIRLNGEDVKHLQGKVINGHIVLTDTIKNGNTAKVINGHIALDTIIMENPYNFTNKNLPVSKQGFSFERSFSINHLPGKLVIIDGKEASENELKNLPASNIESMSIKAGDEITKNYGDKAKNGVVFITTIKSN